MRRNRVELLWNSSEIEVMTHIFSFNMLESNQIPKPMNTCLYTPIVWLRIPMLQLHRAISIQFLILVVLPFRIYQPNHSVCFETLSTEKFRKITDQIAFNTVLTLIATYFIEFALTASRINCVLNRNPNETGCFEWKFCVFDEHEIFWQPDNKASVTLANVTIRFDQQRHLANSIEFFLLSLFQTAFSVIHCNDGASRE